MKKKIFSIALLGVLLTGCSNVNNSVQNSPVQNNDIQNNLNIKNEEKTTTYIDSATGLMWQQDNDAKTIKKDWDSAKAYCENLTLGGFNDWRLPNIYELNTLLDNTKSLSPRVIDGIENKNNNNYWSSTAHDVFMHGAWVVYFFYGSNEWDNKTDRYSVRCVRAGELNFDNLVILKNQGKLKVSQKNIDEISPEGKAKRIKELEINKQKELAIQKKLELEQKDKSAYDVASSINTINSYKEYIKNYPNGNYVQNARSNMDYLSPEKVAQRKREDAEREKQAKIREEQKFQLGNSVCYSGHTSNSGWCGSIENIRGDKIQVEITKISINGFLSTQLNASECTGNKDIKYHDEGKLIWVSKYCVD